MLGDGVEDVWDVGEFGWGGSLCVAEERGGDWRARCIHSDLKPCWRFIIVGDRGKVVHIFPASCIPSLWCAAVEIFLADGKGRFVNRAVG